MGTAACLCWIFFVAIVSADQIPSAEGFVSSVQTRSSLIQAATIITRFESGVKISVPCVGQSLGLSGCTAGDGTMTKPLCPTLDVQKISVSANSLTYFRGTVSNPNTCGGFVLTIKGAKGNPKITLNLANMTQTVFVDHMTMPYKTCCKDLVARGWDGSFTLMVAATQVSEFELLIPSDLTNLALADYYNIVPVTVDCPSRIVQCVGKFCPFNVRNTADPFFTYFSTIYAEETYETISSLQEETEEADTISTIAYIQVIEDSSKVPTFGSGLGTEVLDINGDFDDQCSITFNWLVTSDGFAEEMTFTISQKPAYCNKDDFDSKVQVWDSVISALDAAQNTSRTTAQTNAYVNLAHISAASFAWNSCKKLALSYFKPVTAVEYQETNGCFTPPGTPEYNKDPCCNVALQKTLCCADRVQAVFSTEYKYNTNINGLQESCAFPYCAEVLLRSYQNTISSSQQCTAESDKAKNDPRFYSNPYPSCFAKIFGKKCLVNSQCAEIADSKCDYSQATCQTPCSETNPCYKGECKLTAYGNVCVGGSTDFETGLLPAFVNCILGSIDPYLKALITDEVYDPTVSTPFYKQFVKRITAPSCLDPITKLLPWNLKVAEGEKGCVNTPIKWCDWLVGEIPGDRYRESECINPLPSSHLCVLDLGSYLHIPIGNPATCGVRLSDVLDADLSKVNYNPSYCKGIDPTYDFVNLPSTNYQAYSSCVRLSVKNANDCYPDYCIAGLTANPAVVCQSYCTFPIPQAACTNINIPPIGYRTWKTWTGRVSGTTFSACIYVGIPRANCLAGGGTWRMGMQWYPDYINSPEACVGVCDYQTKLVLSSKAECENEYSCTSCVTGTEESCKSKEACEKTFNCDNESGCFFYPQFLATLPFDVPCAFTPNGCIGNYLKPNCEASSAIRGPQNIFWQNRFLNQTQCTTNSFICRLKGTPKNKTYVGAPRLPDGFSLQNKTECEACGGTYESFFKWVPAEWRRIANWLDLKWMPKRALAPVWENQINEKKFLELLEQSRAGRLANILSGELFCRYGTERELFSSLSCNCGENQGGCDKQASSAIVLSGMSACTGVEGKITTQWITENPLVFDVSSNFTVSTGDLCIKVKLLTVPLFLLQKEETVTLSSLSITSESSIKSTLGKQFIYNTQDPAVVVGQIIGDGIGFDINVDGEISGFSVCIEFPEFDDWQLRMDPAYKTIVVSDINLETFEIMDLNLSLETTQYCLDITHDAVFFPAIIIEDWSELELKNSWPSGELGFSIALAILYAILAIFSTFSLGYGIFSFFEHKNRSKTISDFFALLFLVVLTILRTIYFSGVPSGAWESSIAPIIILGDLPALLFLGTVILTGLKWAEVYYRVQDQKGHEKKSKTLVIFSWFLIITIFIVFIILSSVYGAAVNDVEEYNCENPPPSDLTYEESVSLVYKCIFAFYCLVTAFYFAWYGGNFIMMVHKFTNDKKARESRMKKFLSVTALCVTALLVLSAILIASTTVIFDNMAKFAIILCIEWLPICGLCIFFGFHDYIMAKERSAASKSSKASGGSSSAKTKSQKTKSKGSSSTK